MVVLVVSHGPFILMSADGEVLSTNNVLHVYAVMQVSMPPQRNRNMRKKFSTNSADRRGSVAICGTQGGVGQECGATGSESQSIPSRLLPAGTPSTS